MRWSGNGSRWPSCDSSIPKSGVSALESASGAFYVFLQNYKIGHCLLSAARSSTGRPFFCLRFSQYYNVCCRNNYDCYTSIFTDKEDLSQSEVDEIKNKQFKWDVTAQVHFSDGTSYKEVRITRLCTFSNSILRPFNFRFSF